MRFRPLQINYKDEALNYQEDQLHSQFFCLPHVTSITKGDDDDGTGSCAPPNSATSGTVTAHNDRNKTALLHDLLTNISLRSIDDSNTYPYFSTNNCLKSRKAIRFIVTDEEASCNNEWHQRNTTHDLKNQSMYTIAHSYRNYCNIPSDDNKCNTILPAATFLKKVAVLQIQQQSRTYHDVITQDARFNLPQFKNLLLNPPTYYCYFNNHKVHEICNTSSVIREEEQGNNNNTWLMKRKKQWRLQRELIRSKRLTRKQRPWWYYYYYQKNSNEVTTMETDTSNNLAVIQLDLEIPSLLPHDSVIEGNTSTTTTVMFTHRMKTTKPFISEIPTQPLHQQEQHNTLVPQQKLLLKSGGYDNIEFITTNTGKESSILYESCAATSNSAINTIMTNIALPPPDKDIHKDVTTIKSLLHHDNLDRNNNDNIFTNDVPSSVAILSSLFLKKKSTTSSTKSTTMQIATIPPAIATNNNDNNSCSKYGKVNNIIESRRVSDIMSGSMKTNSYYCNNRRFLALLPQHYQQVSSKKGDDDDDDDECLCLPSSISLDEFRIQFELHNNGDTRHHQANWTLSCNYPIQNWLFHNRQTANFVFDENSSNNNNNIDKDSQRETGYLLPTTTSSTFIDFDTNKLKKKKSNMIRSTQIQLMTGCCTVEQKASFFAYNGFISCEKVDVATYQRRYLNGILRRQSNNFMTKKTLQLQASYYVFLLPKKSKLQQAKNINNNNNNRQKKKDDMILLLSSFLLQTKRKKRIINTSFCPSYNNSNDNNNKTYSFTPSKRMHSIPPILFVEHLVTCKNGTPSSASSSCIQCTNVLYDDWMRNGAKFERTWHESIALRGELLHLMAKASDLVLSCATSHNTGSSRDEVRNYHHGNGEIKEAMAPPLPEGSNSNNIFSRQHDVKKKKRKKRELMAKEEQAKHKKKKIDDGENKKRKDRSERNLLAQDVINDSASTSTVACFQQAVDVDTTVQLKIAKKASANAYQSRIVIASTTAPGFGVSPFVLPPRGKYHIHNNRNTVAAGADSLIHKLQNSDSVGNCTATTGDCNKDSSRQAVGNDEHAVPFKIAIATKGHPRVIIAAPSTNIKTSPPFPLLDVKKGQAIHNNSNGIVSESSAAVQNFQGNNATTQSMMNNFFTLLGRPKAKKSDDAYYGNVLAQSNTLTTKHKLVTRDSTSASPNKSNTIREIKFTASISTPAFKTPAMPPVSVLCSGYFLENFSETVATLASGRWSTTLLSHKGVADESLPQVESGRRILLYDSPIVDFVGVDIELPCGYGIICTLLSQWLVNAQHQSKTDVKTFVKRVLCLAATGRYSKLRIHVVCDTHITQALSMNLFTLQNTVVMQQDCSCPCEVISVHITSIHSLSTSIAHLILEEPNHYTGKNSPEDWGGSLGLSRKKMQDRAMFLISMAPTFTALTALSYIHAYLSEYEDATGNSNTTRSPICIEKAFSRLLHDVRTMTNDGEQILFRIQQKGASEVSQKSILQLSMSIKCVLVT